MDPLDDVEYGEPHNHLLKRPPVDIEFSDLTYSVPQGRNGEKLKNIVTDRFMVIIYKNYDLIENYCVHCITILY